MPFYFDRPTKLTDPDVRAALRAEAVKHSGSDSLASDIGLQLIENTNIFSVSMEWHDVYDNYTHYHLTAISLNLRPTPSHARAPGVPHRTH